MVESTFLARALLYLKSHHFMVFLCKEREKYVPGFTIVQMQSHCFARYSILFRGLHDVPNI